MNAIFLDEKWKETLRQKSGVVLQFIVFFLLLVIIPLFCSLVSIFFGHHSCVAFIKKWESKYDCVLRERRE